MPLKEGCSQVSKWPDSKPQSQAGTTLGSLGIRPARTVAQSCLFSAVKPAVSEDTAKVWSLSAGDMLDDDIVSRKVLASYPAFPHSFFSTAVKKAVREGLDTRLERCRQVLTR